MISKELREFLAAWLEWSENGAPEHPTFNRHQGLCTNLYRYGVENFAEKRDIVEDEFYEIRHSGEFEDGSYPFGGFTQYTSDNRRHYMHTNPERLAWVRAKLQETERWTNTTLPAS